MESNEKANGLLKQYFPSVTGLIRNPTLRECRFWREADTRQSQHQHEQVDEAQIQRPVIGLKIPVPEIISLLAE